VYDKRFHYLNETKRNETKRNETKHIMASFIPTITSEELENLSDSFWIKLGAEQCNIHKRMLFIDELFIYNFTKTNPLLNRFKTLKNLYKNLSITLEDIVCKHYPYRIPNKEDVMFITVPPSLKMVYQDDDANEDKTISIVGIFHDSATVKRYPVTVYKTDGNKRYSSYISPGDMEFINDSITYLDNYLNYLRNICDKLTKNKQFKKKLLKSISNIESKRKQFDELSSDIPVKENYEVLGVEP